MDLATGKGNTAARPHIPHTTLPECLATILADPCVFFSSSDLDKTGVVSGFFKSEELEVIIS